MIAKYLLYYEMYFLSFTLLQHIHKCYSIVASTYDRFVVLFTIINSFKGVKGDRAIFRY